MTDNTPGIAAGTSFILLAIDRALTEAERATILDQAARKWPRTRGAQVADILEMTTNGDQFLRDTEPFFEAHADELAGLRDVTPALHTLIMLGADLSVANVMSLLQRAGLAPHQHAEGMHSHPYTRPDHDHDIQGDRITEAAPPESCPVGHQKPVAGCTWCEENIDPGTWRERWAAPDDPLVVAVTNFDLLRVLDGHPMTLATLGGTPVVVRLYVSPEELMAAQRAAAEQLGGPDPGMSREQAASLIRPLSLERLAQDKPLF